jgi:preprotein translocase subunit SecG
LKAEILEKRMWDFIKNNTLSLFSILIIIVFIVISILLIIEMRKLKKQLNDNSNKQQNNVTENIDVKESGSRKQTKKEGKYSEEEIEGLLLDLMMSLKKTIESLDRWKRFAIFIIIAIISIIIMSFLLPK